MRFLFILENFKIYIKTYIKIAPTFFGLRPLSGSLHLSLAKVTYSYVKTIGKIMSLCVMQWCGSSMLHAARLKCKLPDDGRRPKNVGAILM
jgi:hypothetical protein